MDPTTQALGEVLSAARKQAGLSQEVLAYRAKLHPTYVSQLERGIKSPTVRTLAVLAKALGTEPSELLRRCEQLLHSRASDSGTAP